MKVYALYNPYAGNGTGEESAKAVSQFFQDELELIDMTRIESYDSFASSLEEDDKIVVCGGDGTLNRFINAIYNLNIENEIYYYATGTGNDFLRDLGKEKGDAPFVINEIMKDLPIATVNGKEYRFLNNVGFGIDGYCCEEGDRLRADPKKKDKINYTSIAIKGLLFKYKPTNAIVTVDGVRHEFKKAWLAPTMVGRYYGGGMMPAPEQTREKRREQVSVALIYGSGKLKTLMIFPSIFKGELGKYPKHCVAMAGKHIVVEFDSPRAIQIDGETISGVSSYEVRLAD